MKKDVSMKALVSYRFALAIAIAIVALTAVCTATRAIADPTSSPLVGKYSPAELWKYYGARLHANETKTWDDVLQTPLALLHPQLTGPAGNTPDVITSNVQTNDFTLPLIGGTPKANSATNVDPSWSPDESYIIYSSKVGIGLFHLYAISSSGTSTTAVPLTAGANNERWASITSDNEVVYCATTGATGAYSLYLATIISDGGVLSIDTAHASLLVSGDTLDCEHPSYSGGSIVFAGRKPGTAVYHLYTFDTTAANPSAVQLTNGVADEENPSFNSTGDLIAFDSNASGYRATGTSPAIDSLGVASNRNVFVTSLSGAGTVQFTSPRTDTINSIEPAWAVLPTGTPIIGAGTRILFSSDRVDAHYGIWYLNAVANPGDGPVIEDTENVGGNVAVNLLTSDPLKGIFSTGATNNFEPAAPNFNHFFKIIYVSPRFLINGILDNPIENDQVAPAYAAPDVEPGIVATNPLGSFTPGFTEQAATGGFEILGSQLFDIDAPSLVRYSTSEIVHTEDATVAPSVPARLIAAGDTVKFLVRVSDRQSGVAQMYLQIKNPNSKYQAGSAGLEHKVFSQDPGNSGYSWVGQHPAQIVDDGGFWTIIPGAPLHPAVNEATTLWNQLAGRAFGGDAIGGYDAANAIFPGHIVTSAVQPIAVAYKIRGASSANTYPTDGYPNQAELTAFKRGIVDNITLSDVQNLSDAGGENHLTGDILQLYDYTGTASEECQITSSNYDLTQAAPITGTFQVTPVLEGYEIPTGAKFTHAGYAVVIATSNFDPMGLETDCEAIRANATPPIDATNPNNFVIPRYLPGFDDQTPQSGDGNIADASENNGNVPVDNVWLPLKPVPPGDPLFDKNGGVLYEAVWKTPQSPSDYYVDVVAYDNAGLATDQQNWKIYDNIWGFTTQVFANHTSPGGILLVNDYMLPQKWFSNGRFGLLGPGNVPESFFGAESYFTDVDLNYEDTANNNGQEAWEPDSAFDTNDWLAGNQTTAIMTQLYHRPAGSEADPFAGVNYTPFYPSGLGVNSYQDSEQTNVIPNADVTPVFPLGNTSGIGADGNNVAAHLTETVDDAEMEYANAPVEAPSQKYDIWRVLCRGTIPISTLNAYGAHIYNQVPDPLAKQPAKNVIVSPSCVIWSSPFSGDEFTASGTITDPTTEANLSAFVDAGGRLYVEGIDVGFALTSNGNLTNSFYANTLESKFISDSVAGGAGGFTLTGATNQTDYISYDAFENNSVPNGQSNYPEFFGAVAHGNFKLANTTSVSTIPNWTYLPPAEKAGRLGLAYDDRNGIGTVNSRTDASLADGGTSVLGIGNFNYIDAFSNLLVPPGATGPLVGSKQATELSSGLGNQLEYANFAPPSGVALGNGIAAYASFGIESISQEAVTLTMNAPSAAWVTPAYNVVQEENQRTDLIHNLICFMRTGTLEGLVTNDGSGQSGATVIAYPESDGGFNNTAHTIGYTAITNGFGQYQITGVPSGRYDLYAYYPGTSFQHIAGSFVDVHGGDIGQFNLAVSPAPPGSVLINVQSALTGGPLAGASITLTEAVTGTPVYHGTSGSGGSYFFSSVDAGTYIVTVSLTGYATYTSPAADEITVTTGDETTDTVSLLSAPNTVTGVVTDATTHAGIGGAQITLTPLAAGGITPPPVVTNSSGRYIFSGNVEPGSYTITCAATSYVTQTVTPFAVANPTTITPVVQDFALSKAATATVYGLVSRAADGVAVYPATVTLTNNANSADVYVVATSSGTITGPDGAAANFEKIGIPYATYTVSLTANGYPAVASQTLVLDTPTKRINFELPSVHAFSAGLQLISVPYNYVGATAFPLAQIFGYANPTLAVWEPANNQYAITPTPPANTLLAGIGYWVRFPHNVGLLLAGTPLSQAAGTKVTIGLQTGWNMIGEPFLTNVPISNLTFTDSAGNNYSFAQASSSAVQLISPNLYYYNQGAGVYSEVGAGSNLQGYYGYWIQALDSCTMVVTHP